MKTNFTHRGIAIMLICFLTACSGSESEDALQAGVWASSIIPANHPELSLAIELEVLHVGDGFTMSILTPDGSSIKTRQLQLEADTLSFVFNEPEADSLLTCKFVRQNDRSFAGNCTDSGGKSAFFKMTPPDE